MTGVDLLALYHNVTREAFRLEAQQRYAVAAESAQFQAFREGRPLPSDPAVTKSMEIIKAATARGAQLHRVHVVDVPLSPYLQYETAAYAENIAAGERVSIANRAWHPDLAALDADFVLFDPGTSQQAVVWMRYDSLGRLTGREFRDDQAEVDRARHRRDIAIAHAIPLHEFTALADTR
jgi:hypothetical protein